MSFINIQFEEEIRRNPYSVKTWWDYAHAKADEASPLERFAIYERAVSYLPRSYKLWHAYLIDRVFHLRNTLVNSKKYELLVDVYERALVFMNKMPRIWLDYCKLMIRLHKGTATRKIFDRALEALPITQHKEIWNMYISWIRAFNLPELAIRVYRRYLMFDPSYREEYVTYLIEIEQYLEAANQLIIILNDPMFLSPTGQSQHQLWMKLCEICCKHPVDIGDKIQVEEIIRSGIVKYTDEVAMLWTSLADYYIRLGQFEKARDIYEEAMNSVNTVRDFTVVFDTYIKVEEKIITTKMTYLNDLEEDEKEEEMNDVQLRLARLEYIMEQRPMYINNVHLRQNPHNVNEWCKRLELVKDDSRRVLFTIAEAIQIINPKIVAGKLSSLYILWGGEYEQRGDVKNTQLVYEKAVYVNYKTMEECVEVWIAYAEMWVRKEEYEKALEVMRRAVQEPSLHPIEGVAAGGRHIVDKLHRSPKIWAHYLDLEESLGTKQTVCAAYERVMELKVITVQMLLNYASYLEDLQYYEESFAVYERGLEIFHFPSLKVIYNVYIEKFMGRYSGGKLERLRDIFESAIDKSKGREEVGEYFIQYAKVEEEYGLVRNVLKIYSRAVESVGDKLKLDMYRLYIKKTEQHLSAPHTRTIYDAALPLLSEPHALQLSLDYAAMERKLNEIDRARAIYCYAAQFADPRRETEFYRIWREFEENHGNEETFREMLRVTRSVQVAFSQVNYMASDFIAASTQAPSALTADPMAKAEEQALEEGGQKRKFVSATTNAYVSDADEQKAKMARNDEELDI